MSRSRYRGSSRGQYRSRSYGLQRALAHIAAAKRLTAELGGMDQAVKEYFFELPPSELAAVLDEYERVHGSLARGWADRTMPKWRAGRVQMSGEVGERLFNLLPPRMPLAAKYKLVEGLWHHLGPSSKYRLRVGPDADLDQVVEFAKSKISEFVVKYKIPADLERRFNWLSAGDVAVKQLFLAHVQEIEKKVAVEVVRAQLPVMLDKRERSQRGSVAPELVKAGVSVLLDGHPAIAQNKTIIIDPDGSNPVVETGSFNFTYSAEHRNAENVLIVRDDHRLAATYERYFQERLAASEPWGRGG